jgi:L,D-transpeptidase catalytic domain
MKDGHAIHGSYEVKRLGKPVSHGCVRIAPQNATVLYDLVKKTGIQNTQVVLSGETPGGESKVAARSKSRVAPRFVESYAQPQRRGGFFRRLFGGP